MQLVTPCALSMSRLLPELLAVRLCSLTAGREPLRYPKASALHYLPCMPFHVLSATYHVCEGFFTHGYSSVLMAVDDQ